MRSASKSSMPSSKAAASSRRLRGLPWRSAAFCCVGLVFGVIPFDPLAMTTAMAAGLGGVVTLGSNNATAKEAAAQMAEAEAARAALIGEIDLRVVEKPRHAALTRALRRGHFPLRLVGEGRNARSDSERDPGKG